MLRDLSYLRLYASYQKDLDVYFHIIEAETHNNITENTERFVVTFQFQGRALFLLTLHISGCTSNYLGDLGAYSHVIEVRDNVEKNIERYNINII